MIYMTNDSNKASVKVYEMDNCVTQNGLLVMEFEYVEDWGPVLGVDTCGVLFTPELLGDDIDQGFFINLFNNPSVYNPL